MQKTVPHNTEAEKALIGSMLMDRDVIPDVMVLVTKEDFYARKYGLMYEVITKLYDTSDDSAIDIITVMEQLAKAGAPADMQTADFIREIYEADPVSINAGAYARIVRDKAVQRRMIRLCEEISQRCFNDTEDTEDILSEAERAISNIAKSSTGSDLIPLQDLVISVFNKFQYAKNNPDHITGVKSGFRDLDMATTGFQPGDLVLIGARPSMGKTAFALNILENVGIRQKRPCIFFSLEMAAEQLVSRLFTMDSRIDYQDLRAGRITEQDVSLLMDSAERINDSNIIIDDISRTLYDLRARCKKVKANKGGLDLVMVDYLQLMSSGSIRRADTRQQEVAEISRGLKLLAKELSCPIIALSQLSRNLESRSDKRPMLSDLRESGSIEQDADIVMFLHREDYQNRDPSHKGEAELIIAKQRNGPVCTIELYFQAETTRFVSKEKRL